jgi:hypothetical protein
MTDTTRSIVCIVDMNYLIDLYNKQDRPTNVNLTPSDIETAITLICQDKEAVIDNGTSTLTIKANLNDTITWMETNIDQSPVNDIVINDIIPISGEWSSYMENFGNDSKPDYATTDQKQVMKAYYNGTNLQYSNGSMDFTKSKVIRMPGNGTSATLNYNIKFALVGLDKGQATLLCNFSYDPAIKLQS